MSALDLDALEALCDGATPGPWKVVDAHTVMDPAGFCVAGTEWESDGAFIAAARDAVPALITRLRAAEARTAWQPIASVPIGETVMLWTPVRRVHVGHVTTLAWCEYTHWAPLPAAPEAP